MKQLVKQAGFMVASLAMVIGLAAVPVSAEHGSDNPSTHEGGGNVSQTQDTKDTTVGTTTEANDDSTSGSGGGDLRKQAQDLLQTKREGAKEHTMAVRQKACEQRQGSIDTRTKVFADAAVRHLGVFDQVFTKVQAFHDNKHLNVTNYDTLVAAVKIKQAAAQSAVDVLKTLDVQIDCTQPDPAATVATIKQAVVNARTTLHAYRTSLKDLIVALKGASTATTRTNATDKTDTTSGGTQ